MNLLNANQVFAKLNQLSQTAAAIAGTERSLDKDLRSRRYALHRRRDSALETQQVLLESTKQEIDQSNAANELRYQELYARRRQRVERLANTARRNLPKRIEEERSRYLGQLQWRKRKAEADFATQWQAFERRVSEWDTGVAEAAERTMLLGKRSRIAASPFGSHLKGVRAALAVREEVITPPASGEKDRLLADLLQTQEQAELALRSYATQPLGQLFRLIPLVAWILIALVAAGVVGSGLFTGDANWPLGGLVGGAALLVMLVLYGVGAGKSAALRQLLEALQQTQSLQSSAEALRDQARESTHATLEKRLNAEREAVQEAWDRVEEVAASFEQKARARLERQPPRILATIERNLQRRMAEIEASRAANVEEVTGEAGRRNAAVIAQVNLEIQQLEADEASQRLALRSRWEQEVLPLLEDLRQLQGAAGLQPVGWTPASIPGWQPGDSFPTLVRVGEVHSDLQQIPDGLPQDNALQLADAVVKAPLALGFPECGSLLIESRSACNEPVAALLNQAMLAILTSSPAGKAAFTILDPVGLGQNFAGLMHLADYEENLINRRIWTQRDQIDERLAELNEHIEKVIQMYLRNEYETITAYNEQAGSVAEKYHFLVIADFPSNFSETAMQRLQSIIISGPRCGVFTLLHWNTSQPVMEGFGSEELRANSLCLQLQNGAFISPMAVPGSSLHLDQPPVDAIALDLVHHIGKASIDSNRVQVPFTHIAPAEGQWWMDSTTQELRVPVGRTGATKLQYLAIGKGTRQHALFAGKTGSGKSTLFHVIITNLALHCSPDEVEFYLIDFKKGVEFKCYAEANLPHARVIAIESDREFGLSVLQRVDEELRRRGDLFRALGAQDIPGYKRAGGREPMPRSLLIIDEFQEFFVEDDSVAQSASVLFDRIVRQGRAFGIHVLLGSQTLGGAYTLARATLGQMVIRVALQCNEADAALIMDENNPAPRLLSRPGEGIYNDAAGAVEGNSPFQVVWINDEERNAYLKKLSQMAEERYPEREPAVIFEGNAPADLRDNKRLSRCLTGKEIPRLPTIWLGAPNAIKGPTEAAFQRQSGNHLLIVGQREEAIVSMLGLAAFTLARQLQASSGRILFFHSAAPDTSDADFLETVYGQAGPALRVVRGHDLNAIMAEIQQEMDARSAAEKNDAPPWFIMVHGLHKFKKLRHEDDMDFSFSASEDEGPKPGAILNTLITEGSALGMHLIASLDTYNNVSRCLSRKALTEFEMRVVFQMSANDSASLIDATKAADLGLHRALLYNEQQGLLETFRPYAMPAEEWFGEGG
jgi:S-DNA-T family DNA segregation ATPase FtsK/SpoIIIE